MILQVVKQVFAKLLKYAIITSLLTGLPAYDKSKLGRQGSAKLSIQQSYLSRTRLRGNGTVIGQEFHRFLLSVGMSFVIEFLK